MFCRLHGKLGDQIKWEIISSYYHVIEAIVTESGGLYLVYRCSVE